MRDERNIVSKAVGKGNICLKHYRRTKGRLLVLTVVLSLLSLGCKETKYAQCEQIFQIAHRLDRNIDNFSYFENQQPTDMKSWLEAARAIERSANHLEALHINDSELIEYQNKFVTLYRIYSQATYDAVKAWENQNFQALESARNVAQKAGQMQQDSIQQINAYCLNT